MPLHIEKYFFSREYEGVFVVFLAPFFCPAEKKNGIFFSCCVAFAGVATRSINVRFLSLSGNLVIFQNKNSCCQFARKKVAQVASLSVVMSCLHED